ncbi:uncharacterized protein LOC126609809 [Malus sylvestris]|uniref:uncharacterized protein LOC126609809 n=1 Tax=Malus sylvestris TaxID=3752 RepID=UPI0021AC0893|nr:uncharacterized protein LOC126609809 [Malus sylvestris]XP_050133692.1 uncharacterized protein LOC126609809 [Malus sylvestris]
MGPGSSTYNERNLSKELTDKQVKPFISLGYIQDRNKVKAFDCEFYNCCLAALFRLDSHYSIVICSCCCVLNKHFVSKMSGPRKSEPHALRDQMLHNMLHIFLFEHLWLTTYLLKHYYFCVLLTAK